MKIKVIFLSLLCQFSEFSFGQSTFSTWACLIPCIDSETKTVVRILQQGYCSDQIDERTSFIDFSKTCRKELGRFDVEATPHVTNWNYSYSCRTTHNSCSTAGSIKLNFTCRFECAPSTNLTYKAICATNQYQAWDLATKGCPEPRIRNPEINTLIDVCSPDGYKGCP